MNYLYCHSCGQPIRREYDFCIYCGATQAKAKAATDPYNIEAKYCADGCRQLHSIIKGTMYSNIDGTSREWLLNRMYVGEPLYFHPYLYEGDPAIAIYNSRSEMVGNLSADLAEEFVERFEKGEIGSIYYTECVERDSGNVYKIIINIKRASHSGRNSK
jgi:hypothetical protein